MISVIDVGVGNAKSVFNWIKRETEDCYLVADPSEYRGGSLVIPGVCSSTQLMSRLLSTGWKQKIISAAAHNRVLGICAGYQVLSQVSYEDERVTCLGLLPGKVVPISKTKSNTGWEKVEIDVSKLGSLKKGLGKRKKLKGWFYFNHCYAVENGGLARNWQACGNVLGVQFHPEKSGLSGLPILEMLMS